MIYVILFSTFPFPSVLYKFCLTIWAKLLTTDFLAVVDQMALITKCHQHQSKTEIANSKYFFCFISTTKNILGRQEKWNYRFKGERFLTSQSLNIYKAKLFWKKTGEKIKGLDIKETVFFQGEGGSSFQSLRIGIFWPLC